MFWLADRGPVPLIPPEGLGALPLARENRYYIKWPLRSVLSFFSSRLLWSSRAALSGGVRNMDLATVFPRNLWPLISLRVCFYFPEWSRIP